MQRSRLLIAAFGLLSALVRAAAGANVEAVDLAPAGQWLACNLGPGGVRAAVLMKKGAQQTVWVDGVEGPAFDELLPFDGKPYMLGPRPMNTGLRIPVVFSDDGAHHAYIAKSGADYVVYRDGRELARGRHGVKLSGLTFSAGGHHLYYMESDPVSGTRLVMDGKPEAPLQETPKLIFSPDGRRYAYLARKKGQPRATLFVDGQEAPYVGEDPQFTRDGATLVTVARANNNHTVLLDGKPLFRARHVFKVHLSPYGDQMISAVANERGIGTHLRLFDKEIPDSECGAVRRVYFSPDGRRYAALCSNHGYTQNLKRVNQGEFIFLDGKRGAIYDKIRDAADTSQDMSRQMWISGGHMRPGGVAQVVPGFTPDSSKFVYMPSRNFEEFVVANEEASEAHKLGRAQSPVFGGGSRIAYIVSEPKPLVVVDGQARDLPGTANSLSFSADGARYAYVWGRIGLDGVDLPLTTQSRYLFSPDGKHFALFGQNTSTLQRGLFIEDQLVLAELEWGERPVFTPDSRHLFWLGKRNTRDDEDAWLVLVDGKPAVAIRELINTRDNWEMSATGVLTFVARAGDALKRFRITPAAGDGVRAMIAAAKAGGAPKFSQLAPPAAATVVASAPAAPPPAPESPPAATSAPDKPADATATPPTAAPPTAPAAPNPVADATKKAADAVDATANKARAWLESLGRKKK